MDFDQAGLMANGETYELAREGYFAERRRARQGYQASLAYIGGALR